ncbi:MAG TPA: ABC transporter permease [Gaiellaceae bacterium]|jgi:peptide/nickel transport system permease protein
MGRFLLRRFLLALVTLFLLSVIVFLLTQLLPGNIGRNVLGGFASPESVAKFNHEHGVDKPLVTQYWNWITNFAQGDMGESLQYQGSSVASLLGPALVNSLKLAALAFVLVVPLSILGGVLAALRQNRLTDRAITIGGISLTAVPEFVTLIVLIVIFGVALKWLPTTAQTPDGAGFFTQIKFLLLPAMALVIVLFGYIARITRSGTIEALDADYTRTAYLKGLSQRVVLRRHVLRNALLPTIAVVATQTGYLIGGLLIIEKLSNYPGIGQRIYTAALNKDYTMLESGVLVVGIVYLVATLFADLLYSLLNPRIRYGAAE